MCYWVGTKKVREEMERRFREGPQDEIAQLFYETFITRNNAGFKDYYVAIGKQKPTLTTLIKENGKLQFRNMQWTLPYSYTDKTGKEITRELLNSTCERVFFQHADIIYKQRCIIPIDGYYEFYHLNGETFPYFIYPKDGSVFYAGGLWSRKVNEQTGEVLESFSIVTTPPNPLTARIHNNPTAPNGPRMLCLIDPVKALNYLNQDMDKNEIKTFFTPSGVNQMDAHTVIRFLKKENNIYFNTPKTREFFEYKELVA